MPQPIFYNPADPQLGWYHDGSWEGLSANHLKYILRDITNAIHEREALLGYGEVFGQDAVPIKITKVNDRVARADMWVSSRQVTLEGSCSTNTKVVFVNNTSVGVSYSQGSDTWTFSGELQEGKNIVRVTGYDVYNQFCYPDQVSITVDSLAPYIISAEAVPYQTIDIQGWGIPQAVGYANQSTIRIRFNEAVDSSSALDTSNYTITRLGNLNIPTVVRGDAQLTDPFIPAECELMYLKPWSRYGVDLVTTELVTDMPYLIQVSGVSDLMGNLSDSTFLLYGKGTPPFKPTLLGPYSSGVYLTPQVDAAFFGGCNLLGDTAEVLISKAGETVVHRATEFLAGEHLWYYHDPLLLEGNNNYLIREIDFAGNVSESTFLRITKVGGGSTLTGPAPTITVPTDKPSFYTTEPQITLGGLWSGTGIGVFVNRGGTTVNGNTWTKTIPLVKGANQFEVVELCVDPTTGQRYYSQPALLYVVYDTVEVEATITTVDLTVLDEEEGELIIPAAPHRINDQLCSSSREIGMMIQFNKPVTNFDIGCLECFGPTVSGGKGYTFETTAQIGTDIKTVEAGTIWVFKAILAEGENLIRLRALSVQSLTGQWNKVSPFFSCLFEQSNAEVVEFIAIHGAGPYSGPVDFRVTFDRPLINFDSDSIAVTSNANIVSFRGTGTGGLYGQVYEFTVSPRGGDDDVLIYVQITPAYKVRDVYGNEANPSSSIIVKYNSNITGNPWRDAYNNTQGKIYEEEPFTYWLKPEFWLYPCNPWMVWVYWIRPANGPNLKNQGGESNPWPSYFEGIPMAAMFTERDVYYVTEDCGDEDNESFINDIIQEVARVYTLAGGTMTAQMAEFRDKCTYRLDVTPWRIPYMPLGDLINNMRFAISKLVDSGHRRGPTHYHARFCRWVDEVKYIKAVHFHWKKDDPAVIADPSKLYTFEYEYDTYDYAFWKPWNMNDLLLKVNTDATWLSAGDPEYGSPGDPDYYRGMPGDPEYKKAAWIDYTTRSPLDKKIWYQFRDILDLLTCVKWDLSVCGDPGWCSWPTAYLGKAKVCSQNVCDYNFSVMNRALSGGNVAYTEQRTASAYYSTLEYAYFSRVDAFSFGVEFSVSVCLEPALPNPGIAYVDVGYISRCIARFTDSSKIPDWSTKYVRGSHVDSWVVAGISAEGTTPNKMPRNYRFCPSETNRIGSVDSIDPYAGCIYPGGGAGGSFSVNGASFSIGGSSASAGGTTVYNMNDYTSANWCGTGAMETGACVRHSYNMHQTFDWGGICFARSSPLVSSSLYRTGTTPCDFSVSHSFSNIQGTITTQTYSAFGMTWTVKNVSYTYPFTYTDYMGGGGGAQSSGIEFADQAHTQIMGHVDFQLVASPSTMSSDMWTPGGSVTSFVVTNCRSLLRFKTSNPTDQNCSKCSTGSSWRGNGFTLSFCTDLGAQHGTFRWVHTGWGSGGGCECGGWQYL